MTILEFIAAVTGEIRAFYATPADQRREHLGTRVGLLFDTYVEPWDIPIVPDAWVDPALRAILLFGADRVYLIIDGQFSKGDKPTPPWPAMTGPAAEPSNAAAV